MTFKVGEGLDEIIQNKGSMEPEVILNMLHSTGKEILDEIEIILKSNDKCEQISKNIHNFLIRFFYDKKLVEIQLLSPIEEYLYKPPKEINDLESQGSITWNNYYNFDYLIDKYGVTIDISLTVSCVKNTPYVEEFIKNELKPEYGQIVTNDIYDSVDLDISINENFLFDKSLNLKNKIDDSLYNLNLHSSKYADIFSKQFNGSYIRLSE